MPRIKMIRNLTEYTVTCQNYEKPGLVTVPPKDKKGVDFDVPWCSTADTFSAHHIELTVSTNPSKIYSVWQDYSVRGSMDGRFYSSSESSPVDGDREWGGDKEIVFLSPTDMIFFTYIESLGENEETKEEGKAGPGSPPLSRSIQGAPAKAPKKQKAVPKESKAPPKTTPKEKVKAKKPSNPPPRSG